VAAPASAAAPAAPGAAPDPAATAALLAQLQAQAAAQQQQMLAARMAAQAAALATAQATAAAQASRKQRELYIGNLTVHVVSAAMLQELFNGALATLQPPGAPPAVANVNVDSGGKFAFVELRTDELASAALMLDKVELCGRAINVGRPKGYIDPSLRGGNPLAMQAHLAAMAAAAAAARAALPGAEVPGAAPAAVPGAGASPLGAAAQPGLPPPPVVLSAPAAGGFASRCVLLLNLVPAATAADARERAELTADVATECGRFGAVADAAAPPPPPAAVAAGEPARVYVRFADAAGAAAAAAAMEGRMFDGSRVSALPVPEAEHEAAAAGAWPPR
jgi:splicing factor U2AF subunit